MRTGHFYLKTVLVSLFAIAIISYTFYQTRKIWGGTELVIHSPLNGSTLHEELLEIKGNARNASHLTLNDRQIYTDESGVFKEKILLSVGYNIFTFKLEDKFKRHETKTLELMYVPKDKNKVNLPKNGTTTQKTASSSPTSLIQ